MHRNRAQLSRNRHPVRTTPGGSLPRKGATIKHRSHANPKPVMLRWTRNPGLRGGISEGTPPVDKRERHCAGSADELTNIHPTKRRQALLGSNLLRNSRWKLTAMKRRGTRHSDGPSCLTEASATAPIALGRYACAHDPPALGRTRAYCWLRPKFRTRLTQRRFEVLFHTTPTTSPSWKAKGVF